MDFVQEWLDIITATLTTSQLRTLYNVTTSLRTLLLSLTSYVSTTSPSLATIALALIVLFVSLRILDMLWRAVVFWLRLAVRVVLWGAVVLAGAWLYSRGPEGMVEDVQGLVDVWWERYEYYKMQAEAQRVVGGPRGRAGAGRYRDRGRW